jgi:hypothetical protein
MQFHITLDIVSIEARPISLSNVGFFLLKKKENNFNDIR